MSRAWSHGSQRDVLARFKLALLEIPGVLRVFPHPSGDKRSQNNVGQHYQEHNYAVETEWTSPKWLEFELTRNNHCKLGEILRLATAFP